MPDEMLARLAELPRTTHWTYSNTGYYLVRRALECAVEAPLDDVLHTQLLRPLGITARLARDRIDMATLACPAPDYDPAWVYHGCLIGPVAEAAALIDGLLNGPLLDATMRTELRATHPVPPDLVPPPWTEAGYGLGLMAGRMRHGGGSTPALGHTAGGPGSVGAAYHFPDLPGAPTVAVFAPAEAEGSVEAQALALAADT